MTITQSPVKVTQTGFEQELSYLHGGKLRREQFVGFSREHLGKVIAERRAELKREHGGEHDDKSRQ
ncbi:MAG: hypothetical protein ABSB39_14670 [Candidatus Sulfotelmatobacter sp.]|jgi:hypothetical protein